MNTLNHLIVIEYPNVFCRHGIRYANVDTGEARRLFEQRLRFYLRDDKLGSSLVLIC